MNDIQHCLSIPAKRKGSYFKAPFIQSIILWYFMYCSVSSFPHFYEEGLISVANKYSQPRVSEDFTTRSKLNFWFSDREQYRRENAPVDACPPNGRTNNENSEPTASIVWQNQLKYQLRLSQPSLCCVICVLVLLTLFQYTLINGDQYMALWPTAIPNSP